MCHDCRLLTRLKTQEEMYARDTVISLVGAVVAGFVGARTAPLRTGSPRAATKVSAVLTQILRQKSCSGAKEKLSTQVEKV